MAANPIRSETGLSDRAVRLAGQPLQVARVAMPTTYGTFDARAFECPSGSIYLALLKGDVAGMSSVVTRLHSECLTGDTLGSLRCECGVQLRLAMRNIGASDRGLLLYATGHEGRGVGLINKLRAYVEQDNGADTIDANVRLGLAVDDRDYADGASVIKALDVRSIRLLTNNPAKVNGLRGAGIEVSDVIPLATAAHARNLSYLRAKENRLGHRRPAGTAADAGVHHEAIDTSDLLGHVAPPVDRPYLVLKYAQTIDGRIATRTGDSKWISGDSERRISHALRAACDAVLVGVGTVIQDDPQLTVRMVPGVSPHRVVLDSSLRVPLTAKILEADAPTTILSTYRSSHERRSMLKARDVKVRLVDPSPDGVELQAGLAALRDEGVESLLVEGGAKVITSMLAAGVVDRLIVGVAPTIIGRGTDSVGSLGVNRIIDGIQLTNRRMHVLPDDVLLSWSVERTNVRH
jgi:3,4-dihydroxy 2-butanone 4-phosphate synthase/GTP cyclohydrolase II